MPKEKKTSKVTSKGRSANYEKPFIVNASFEDFIKIAVTPKEDLRKEDLDFIKS
jgi:hypothetical protein